MGVGGPPRRLFAKSFMALIHALRIEGWNNVNSANTTTSFKSRAMELVCSMLHTITTFQCLSFQLCVSLGG